MGKSLPSSTVYRVASWQAPSGALTGGRWKCTCHRRWGKRGVLSALTFLVAFFCHDLLWIPQPAGRDPWSPQTSSWRLVAWGAEATSGYDGRFLGPQITADVLKQRTSVKTQDKQPIIDDELLEDEEPLEIWGDIDDRRMFFSRTSYPCAAALRQAFNAALRLLVDRGVRNKLLLKYMLPLSFAVELQGAIPAWPKLQDLHEQDLLRDVLEGRVLRVATVARGPSQAPKTSSFDESFLREIVDEIDMHYSGAEGPPEFNEKQPAMPIQIQYVVKASTAVALQALDAGQAHMTDINMVLSHNPFNGVTVSSRYSRSDQVMTQSTIVIVKSETNIASLWALRESILFSFDQESRTVVVDGAWNHQSLARVLPPFTIYEVLSDGVPGSHLVDVLIDEEAIAATAQRPLLWLHQGLRQFAAGATYATGALFLMDRHSSRCSSTASTKRAAAAASTLSSSRLAEDPALSSVRKELTKKSSSLNSYQKFSMGRENRMWGRVQGSDTPVGFTEHEDSYPATPGPWSSEPAARFNEMELFESLRMDAREPLASGRRYLSTRALQDAYNAALVLLMRKAVLENIIEELQEINVVPFFDCGGTLPGSVARNFPLLQRISPDDALMDILQTGVVLVGMPMDNKTSASSPEVLYAQRAMVEVVATIGNEYHVTLETRFIRFPSAERVLRALHKGLIHFADARVLFEYISPWARLEYRVRPTCALGASRLWMVTQNKDGLASLEELHQTFETSSDPSECCVAVVDPQLQNTVAGVLPEGVTVIVMSVEEAAEALLAHTVTAVFGMATQQRRLMRSLLNIDRRTEKDERGSEKLPEDAPPDSNTKGDSPLPTPQSEGPIVSSADGGSTPVDYLEPIFVNGWPKDERAVLSSEVPTPQSHTEDIFQELMKAEGLPLDTAEGSQQTAASWIEVDTGITAVMHSFLSASLRPPRQA
ncbi:uncharacterized protein LOC34623150 [Cyclospora cayetanensis]|uniref:Uncharacterized protein n=2 Tax=Cyclospora cayetanensis TaxID=88456 RepID=A0A1D3D7Q2_9EIME|nr:uncharacterized protein LOC34623150 [Cyclospora cayetanensis]OEH79486.1 hypothetical protein cyc_07124 [Cyclospora cayetanensis]